jgi:WD40 repeat protein
MSGKICKHGDSISELAIDSSNTRLASGGAGSDTSVYVWDMRSLRSLSRLQAHTKDVSGLVFVTGVTGESGESDEVAGPAVRGGGVEGAGEGGWGDRWLVSGGMDGLLCVWDLLENRVSETNTDTDRERDRDRDRDRATDKDIDRSQGVRGAGPLWQVSLEVRASNIV